MLMIDEHHIDNIGYRDMRTFWKFIYVALSLLFIFNADANDKTETKHPDISDSPPVQYTSSILSVVGIDESMAFTMESADAFGNMVDRIPDILERIKAPLDPVIAGGTIRLIEITVRYLDGKNDSFYTKELKYHQMLTADHYIFEYVYETLYDGTSEKERFEYLTNVKVLKRIKIVNDGSLISKYTELLGDINNIEYTSPKFFIKNINERAILTEEGPLVYLESVYKVKKSGWGRQDSFCDILQKK
jgi:hypothetical protein